jgi:ammonia channel protein AmtB
MISSLLPAWLAQTPTIEDVETRVALDSAILAETFYFWTVVIMWLIHVGFMAYETGVARRKNLMSTAMKNILTIAVVTPSFYYFGWYIYGCMQEGWPKSGHDSPDALPGFCGLTAPWSEGLGPNLVDHISLIFFLAFLLFSWTTGSIMSGAVIERIRLSAYLLLAVLLGSVVWILDAAWGWSSGGWLTTRFGFHDAIASGVVHGVAGAFAFGVLLNLGPRIAKYDIAGRARPFRPHNTHMTLMGLMLIFTGFYGFYAACLVIQSTTFPGWLNIYLSPTTLGTITMVITFGFAGGFTGGWFASKGDPFWTLSGGLAGVIAVSAGADVYHPSLAYLLSFTGGLIAVWVGHLIHPGSRVEVDRIHDERVAVPPADGISVPERPDILEGLPAVHPDLAPDAGPLEELHDLVREHDDLKRASVHHCAQQSRGIGVSEGVVAKRRWNLTWPFPGLVFVDLHEPSGRQWR